MPKRDGGYDVTYVVGWSVRGKNGWEPPIWDAVSETAVSGATIELHKPIIERYLTGELDREGLKVEGRSIRPSSAEE